MNYLILIPLLLLGWLAGAIINYLADVLPETRRLSQSACAACQSPRAWVDFLLMRPCRACSDSRRKRAWVVQLFAALLTAVMWLYPSTRLGYWVGWVVLVYFGLVTVIDMEHKLILHVTSIVGALIGVGVGVWRHGWLMTLMGGLAGFGIMFALMAFGFFVAKIAGKLRGQAIEEDALGFGDAILSGVLGLMLGWPGITAGLTLGIFIGGGITVVYLIYQLIRGKYQMFQAIPYGPFLVAGAAVLLFLM